MGKQAKNNPKIQRKRMFKLFGRKTAEEMTSKDADFYDKVKPNIGKEKLTAKSIFSRHHTQHPRNGRED